MKIYKAEEDIQDIIKANTAIAYTTEIDKSNYQEIRDLNFFTVKNDKEIEEIVTASIKDRELYYHTSILVTTAWNKNDDIFTAETIFEAKDTPVHKPTNLEHDSMKIIGHMTGSWLIDAEGKPVSAKDVAELPNKFHVLVGSVIYKRWPSNEEYEKDINNLIQQIEAGEKFVSMECIFKDFDYAFSDEDGSNIAILQRNENTAFLSKYLRSYGGPGMYNKKKVGRVVKCISFCGKGYVDRPANPESIIFTKDNISDFSSAKYIKEIIVSKKSGVINNMDNQTEKKIMSDNFYKEQYDEANKRNEALAKSLEEMKDKVAQSNLSKLEKEIETLTAQTSDMDGVIKTKSGELTVKEKEVSDLTAKVSELVKANDELIKSNKELTDKFSEIEAQSKITARVSTLVSGGLTKEVAEEKVKVFAGLTDEQFTAVANEIVKANKSDVATSDKTEKVEASAEEVDNATVTDEEVTSASVTENSVDVTSIAKKLSDVFGRK